MRKTAFLILVSASAALGIAAAACGPAQPPPAGPTPTPTPFDLGGRACPVNSTLTYENFGEPFIRGQCLGCHSSDLPEGSRQNAPIGVDFNTYDDVRGWGVRIFYRSADHNFENPPGPMPPAGGPTQTDRNSLGDWLACNAPRESWAKTP